MCFFWSEEKNNVIFNRIKSFWEFLIYMFFGWNMYVYVKRERKNIYKKTNEMVECNVREEGEMCGKGSMELKSDIYIYIILAWIDDIAWI